MMTVWTYLKGKKSAIGATLNAVFFWALIKGYLPETEATMIAVILTAWTGLAVGDKFAKKVQ